MRRLSAVSPALGAFAPAGRPPDPRPVRAAPPPALRAAPAPGPPGGPAPPGPGPSPGRRPRPRGPPGGPGPRPRSPCGPGPRPPRPLRAAPRPRPSGRPQPPPAAPAAATRPGRSRRPRAPPAAPGGPGPPRPSGGPAPRPSGAPPPRPPGRPHPPGPPALALVRGPGPCGPCGRPRPPGPRPLRPPARGLCGGRRSPTTPQNARLMALPGTFSVLRRDPVLVGARNRDRLPAVHPEDAIRGLRRGWLPPQAPGTPRSAAKSEESGAYDRGAPLASRPRSTLGAETRAASDRRGRDDDNATEISGTATDQMTIFSPPRPRRHVSADAQSTAGGGPPALDSPAPVSLLHHWPSHDRDTFYSGSFEVTA